MRFTPVRRSPFGGARLNARERVLALLLLIPAAAGLALSALALSKVCADWSALRETWGSDRFLIATALALSGVACLALLLARFRGWRRGTWHPRNLAPLRFAFVALTIGCAIYVGALQPYWIMTVAIAVALALGAATLGWLLAPLLVGRVPCRWLRSLDFALFQLCLLVVLVELAVPVAGRVLEEPLLDFGRRTAAEEIALWRMEPGKLRWGFPCNSRGDYDVEPSRPPRAHPFVVCIGDSFSAGVVPHYAHYTTVAEGALPGVEIYNMGAPYLGPREYQHLLREEALALEPDLIVIALFMGNDFEQAVDARPPDFALRRWFQREELTSIQLALRIARVRAEQARRPAGAGPIGAGPGARASDSEGPFEREEAERHMPWLADPLQEETQFSREGFEELELYRARIVSSGEIDERPFFRELERIRAAAGDVPLAFLVIPDELQVEDGLWERLRSMDLELAFERRDQLQRVMAAWSVAHGVPSLDLLPVLRAVEPLSDGALHVFHLCDTHFNARGNRIAGLALADFLHGLLDGAR